MTASGDEAIPGPPYRVPCDHLPTGAASSLPATVRHDEAGRVLVVEADLSPAEWLALRNLAGNDADWQLVIDRLVARSEAAQQSRASSFPPTMWGLLLSELGTGDDAAWKRFMTMYRRPIRRVIAGMLARTGRTGDADDLTEEFFSWFFVHRVFDRLVRVSATGHVNRFRGFLSHVLKTFLRESLKPPKAQPVAEFEAPSDPELDPANLVDRELIREAVTGELDIIRADHRSLWRALIRDFSGLTLDAVGKLLREEGDGRGSIATAHRERSRGREVLRQRLIRYRLRHGTLTEEEAVGEYLDLLPAVAEAIVEYVQEHDID